MNTTSMSKPGKWPSQTKKIVPLMQPNHLLKCLYRGPSLQLLGVILCQTALFLL